MPSDSDPTTESGRADGSGTDGGINPVRATIVAASIGGVAAIIGASIAAYATIAVSANQVLEDQAPRVLEERAPSIVGAIIQRDFAPVGTVVASLLTPREFGRAVGEHVGDGPTERTWILADGRDVSTTDYARLTERRFIPDLTGMFLRGVDAPSEEEQVDPAGERIPGDRQGYATALPEDPFVGSANEDGPHQHAGALNPSFNKGAEEGGLGLVTDIVMAPSDGAHGHMVEIIDGGDKETRPANVAVYFYIKIN